jgi:hypothetical protein
MNIAQLMKPTGPIGERFLNDKRMITGIMGPVGSAKTTKCVAKMVKSALWQKPGPDGIYRAKWGVIRDTYPQLRKTALATWFQWFPKALGAWNGEAPYEHTLSFLVIQGGRKCQVELTVIFAAIGENKAEDVMRGWEVTGIWLNEGDLVAYEVFAYAMTRIGRYPSAAQGGCQWRGVIIDMNAPDIENWTYTTLVEKDLGIDDDMAVKLREELGELFGVGFHVQPGGRSVDPVPENIENLPKGYYAQQIMALSKRPHLIRRMVDNLFGPVRHGQSVFPEYQDNVHCAAEKLEPIKGVKLRISADAGNTPAALIGQRDHRGQIRVLGEVVVFAETEEDELQQLGAYTFGLMVGRYVKDEFPGCRLTSGCGSIRRRSPASGEGRRSELAAKLPEGACARSSARNIRVRKSQVTKGTGSTSGCKRCDADAAPGRRRRSRFHHLPGALQGAPPRLQGHVCDQPREDAGRHEPLFRRAGEERLFARPGWLPIPLPGDPQRRQRQRSGRRSPRREGQAARGRDRARLQRVFKGRGR